MSNQLLKIKIESEFERMNGNTNKNTIPIKSFFKTKDSEGKLVFRQRGKAIKELIFFLLDNRITEMKDLALIILQYDWEDPSERKNRLGKNKGI